MKSAYMSYYEKPGWLANMRLLWDAIRAKEPRRRVSLLNRQRDFSHLLTRPDLVPLHVEINRRLLAGLEWPDYDYGEGYFYQGFKEIGITGLRDTDGRTQAYDLRTHVEGKKVLEIGCNAGFQALMLRDVASEVYGFDLNPHIVGIGQAVREHLGADNITLAVGAFEELELADEAWDVVLSFANHSTYDGNTRQSIKDYFERCARLVKPGGKLLFESHPPLLEKDRLKDVLALLGELFEIGEPRVGNFGTFLDRERTFAVATRRV